MPNLVDERTAEDAIYVLTTVESGGWGRKGLDLVYTCSVSLKESILGINRKVKHLDGTEFDLVKAEIRNGEKMTLAGRGLPGWKKDIRGNLQIVFKIVLEEDMTEKMRDKWEEFFQKYKV